MEKKSKKSIIIGITSLFLVTLILLGLTYAYYRTRIIGNDAEKSVSLSSKKLEITYQNESAYIEASGIEPGYSASKTFEVYNSGDETVDFSIMLDNITNTFARSSDWTFTLKEGTTILKTGKVPRTKSYIYNSVKIASGETKSYSITINYANLTDVNQSIDMGKSLSLRINIGEEVKTTFNSAAEGTLLAAIGNDNIISEPLTIPGQQVSTASLYSEVKLSGTTKSMSISNTYASRYWVYGTGYEFDEKEGKYTLTGVKTGKYSDIYNELSGMYLISANASNNSATSASSAASKTVSNLSTIYRVATTSTTALTYQTKSAVASDGEAVLASTEGVNGDTYYFRGVVGNNYVTYSGMCWRIVRVMENGDIKLTLADRDNACGTANGYEVDDTDGAFVADPATQRFAYKYMAALDATDFVYKNSDVAAVLKAWAGTATDRTYTYYDSETEEATTDTFTNPTLDTTKLSTTPNWCIDTSEYRYDDADEDYVEYGAWIRLVNKTTAAPSLNCASALENESQIGILSADEVAFAGSTWYSDVTYNFYLKTNATANSYLTLSPLYLYPSADEVAIINVGLSGSLSSEYSLFYNLYSVRPAVVLDSSVTITSGNGTVDAPYIIG